MQKTIAINFETKQAWWLLPVCMAIAAAQTIARRPVSIPEWIINRGLKIRIKN